ncbi:hypothetical protein H632_c659p0 [Helicosporidium sp. ATCC 50920]|nr:hypothetical protein H632_c659p0 [Helicosporidium sp. ATCC 50920]|eukprot:KDD75489.1 hypothetical protein H632_c659p0 [Helicosporidium sp. ATCC 50920]
MEARCAGALKQLRGIVATFRMTSRAAPLRPSQYVAQLLQPLAQSVSEGGVAARLENDMRQELVQLTLERLARHFLGVAGETLSVVRKTESSLRRFKSRQRLAEGQAQAAAAPSDTGSLVAQQLALDVEEFARLAKTELGVDATQMEAYAELVAVIAGGDELEGAAA